MIVFTKIRYKNFLSSGNLWTEIDLNSHKNTLIMGVNGAGKSTLLDALTFSLFGKPFRKVNKGGVVNSINNKECRVEVFFTIGNKDYKVFRGIKPNLFEIYCNNILINQDAAAKDYQEQLENNILKMNFKTFTQVVILGSASFTPFMQLSAADRRSVIENLLDIQIFSSMSTIVRNRLKVNQDAINVNSIKLSHAENTKLMVETTLESLREDSEKRKQQLILDRTHQRVSMDVLRVSIENTNQIIDELLDQVVDISALREKHTKLITLRAKMTGKKDGLYHESQFLLDNETCPTCKQTIQEDFRQGKIGTNHTKIIEFKDAIDQLDEQLDDLIQDINKVEAVWDQINDKRQIMSTEKARYENHKRLFQSLNNQIENFVDSDKALRDSEEQLNSTLLEISSLQEEKASLLDERQYIDVAATLLKDGGIKTKIVKHYLPIINKSINKILSKMGFFVSFELDENFNETIKSRHRDEFVYNNFSEGEKLRIDLAILLTWRHIARIKNSVDVNILIFDEILDRAMDDSGVDEFIKEMWDVGRNGANVFVISHRNTMTEKFQRTLSFEKVKNFSVLKKDG